jgi:mannosyltransferase
VISVISELIPSEHWDVPSWVDQAKFDESARHMKSKMVKYASMMSYHQMCRWYSGFFYKQSASKDIRYYWHVEPDVKYIT